MITFVAVLSEHLTRQNWTPGQVVRLAKTLKRNAVTHNRISVDMCNHSVSPALDGRPRKLFLCEARITWALRGTGISPVYGGDPRGYTVKLILPTARSNTIGGLEAGWGVPK